MPGEPSNLGLKALAFDDATRTELVAVMRSRLEAALPGSEVTLRGSLAENRADVYSDIDLLWEMPDDAFASAVAGLPATLERVRSVASLRFDPDFQHSTRRRLAFVRFACVPLFWRVDLDIFAASLGRDPDHDRDNPAARGNDWSLTESALMNVVAAMKAQRRGNLHLAADLLARAEQRVGIRPAGRDTDARLINLVATIARRDPETRPLAAEIRNLLEEGPCLP